MIFSDRVNLDLAPNALSRLLALKRAQGQPVLDLTQSNPTRIGLPYPEEEILSALAQPQSLRYEPDPRGLRAARAEVLKYYRHLAQDLDDDAIFLTASTSEAYGTLFKLLGNPGDEILIPSPGYPLLSYLAGFENLTTVSYPLRYDPGRGWYFDLDLLEALITPRTRAVTVVNPNNPTGSYIKTAELEILDDICCRHNLALIVDEVFCDYSTDPAPDGVRSTVTRTRTLSFVLNGLSKMVGLPQVKLGWIIVGGESGRVREAALRLELLLDCYLSVGTPVQHALGRLLALRKGIQNQLMARITTNRRILDELLGPTKNCHTLRREGGWYAVIEICDQLPDEERVLQLLDCDHTLVHPGAFYQFHREGFVVVSLLPPADVFHAGVEALVRRFGQWR
jgi:aspartate/methionine/tyrosine aminotransferase